MNNVLSDKTRKLFLEIGSYNNINGYFKTLEKIAKTHGERYGKIYKDDLEYYHKNNIAKTPIQIGGLFGFLRTGRKRIEPLHCDSYIEKNGCTGKKKNILDALRKLQEIEDDGNAKNMKKWKDYIDIAMDHIVCCFWNYNSSGFERENIYLQFIPKITSREYYCQYALKKFDEIMLAQPNLQKNDFIVDIGQILRKKMNEYNPGYFFDLSKEKKATVKIS